LKRGGFTRIIRADENHGLAQFNIGIYEPLKVFDA
jgi:hypothetical protein